MSFRTSTDVLFDELAVTAAIETETVNLTNQYLFALQVSWANSAGARTISIEVSLDEENWYELPSPSITTAGAGGTEVVQVSDFAYKYARIVCAAGAATDLKLVFNGKGI